MMNSAKSCSAQLFSTLEYFFANWNRTFIKVGPGQ